MGADFHKGMALECPLQAITSYSIRRGRKGAVIYDFTLECGHKEAKGESYLKGKVPIVGITRMRCWTCRKEKKRGDRANA